MGKKVIGIDYGSDSARAVLVDVENGNIISTVAAVYPRWSEGRYCDAAASSFRQHPLDYTEVLRKVLKGVLEGCDCKEDIVGIGVDTTASTPALTDAEGTPLALKEKFADNPDAMFVLWKDHTGTSEAEEIVKVWGGGAVNYCETCGGDYSFGDRALRLHSFSTYRQEMQKRVQHHCLQGSLGQEMGRSSC